MSDVTIYHPELGVQESVPEESLPHHRRAGWRLLSEHQEEEAARGKREAAEAKTTAKASKEGDR